MTDTRDTTAAREALNAYCAQRGTIQAPDEDITDLITDLLHLWDEIDGRPGTGYGWTLIDLATLHYDEERD